MQRTRLGIALALFLTVWDPPNGAAQGGAHRGGLSGELALGISKVGQGGGLSGKAAVRVHPASGGWVYGARVMGMDGARRRATNCLLWCHPVESMTEIAFLAYRVVSLSGGAGALYLGAGPGWLRGRQFKGASADLEAVSDRGLSLEAALHGPPRGFRFVLSGHGHVSGGKPLAGVSVGLGFGR